MPYTLPLSGRYAIWSIFDNGIPDWLPTKFAILNFGKKEKLTNVTKIRLKKSRYFYVPRWSFHILFLLLLFNESRRFVSNIRYLSPMESKRAKLSLFDSEHFISPESY